MIGKITPQDDRWAGGSTGTTTVVSGAIGAKPPANAEVEEIATIAAATETFRMDILTLPRATNETSFQEYECKSSKAAKIHPFLANLLINAAWPQCFPVKRETADQWQFPPRYPDLIPAKSAAMRAGAFIGTDEAFTNI